MGALPLEELKRRSSLVALLFRLERRHSLGGLQALLGEVISWFRQHAGNERLRRLFAELVREALARHRVNLSGSDILLEVKSMLTIDFELSKQEWLAEGMAKGLAEGVAKGKTEGKAEALICLLAERFGAVAPSWQKRIRGAKLVTLERWFKRAIVAPDLPSVFNPPR
jgi:hypothetical protein